MIFAGSKEGEELARAYASADVFVFPSLTDTFGLVLLEALASGVPVAAFPVNGPKDVITDAKAGVLSEDLQAAALGALALDKKAARAHAMTYSWEYSAQQFIDNVLAAHHIGLPERKRRWPRLRIKRPRFRHKESGPVGGKPGRSFSCVSLGDAWGISRPPRNG